MKCFFIAKEHVWNSLGSAMRIAGYAAPSWAVADSLGLLEFRLGIYNDPEPCLGRPAGNVEMIVADESLVQSDSPMAKFLKSNYDGIPVVKFAFGNEAIASCGWSWYPLQLEGFHNKLLAKAAAA